MGTVESLVVRAWGLGVRIDARDRGRAGDGRRSSMNKEEAAHVRIRDEVQSLAMTLARECWPASADNVVVGLAIDGVHAALLQLRAAGLRSGDRG